MYKFLKFTVSAGVLWFVAMLVIFPKECIESGLKGVFLCLDTVIPSLFPFFVCSGIITGLGLSKPLERLMSPFMRPLFGVSGKGALAFTLGLLSGYPVGAVCVADLYGRGECSKTECEKMLAFCNNSGPMFILGAVGATMLDSPALGRWLYIIHILSAILTGIILRFVKTDSVIVNELPLSGRKDFISVIMGAFARATESIISVCGFVIFFCIFGSALRKLGVSSIIHGFLEISGGAEEISNLPIPFSTRLSCLSAIIAFSGLSVMLQVIRIAQKANLSPKLYVQGKCIQSVVAWVLTTLAVKFVPLTANTSLIRTESVMEYGWEMSIGITALVLIFIIYLNKKAVDN